MSKIDFVKQFYPDALLAQHKTGVPALAILAQAAIESGWGKIAPGNMFFGVKDTDGINGNEQLLVTTEYSKSANANFPRIIGTPVPVIRNGQKWFKYKIQDYFRKYKTPEDCFIDHSQFFIKNKRYFKAMTVKNNTYLFIDEIAKAGYATDPNYATLVKSIARSIEKLI